MTTHDLISKCNVVWDLCRLVNKETGEIVKDYFNHTDFFKDRESDVLGWEMYIHKNKTGVTDYITIIIEV